MIIYEYNNKEDDFEEVVKVYPDGDVEGESHLANHLSQKLSNDGLRNSDGENIKEGLELMMILQNRFNNGYYMASWESKDGDILHGELEGF